MTNSPAAGNPRKLIIDTDPGVDDVLAIIYALASAEAEVLALTLTFGNTTLDYAQSNILRLGAVLQKQLNSTRENTTAVLRSTCGPNAKKISVFAGATGPLAGKAFTASYFHGRDGLSSISTLPNDPFPEPSHDGSHPFNVVPGVAAEDAILQILASEPAGTVTIAAVGPVTNLAKAWQKDPSTFSRVGQISIMGGALEHPGNTCPTSEFNFFADPTAANVLLSIPRTHPALGGKPLPIYLLPLDVTHKELVPYAKLVRDEAELHTANPLSQFVSAFLRHPRKMTNLHAPPDGFNPDVHDNFVPHDPLAVAHAIHPEENWVVEEREFEVETEGRLTRGMCVVDRRGYSNKKAGSNQAESNGHSEPMDASPFPIKVITAAPPGFWFAKVFLERVPL